MSAQKIEQLKEMVRCHRAAIDFNTQFCNAVFKVGISLIKKEKKRRRKTAGSIATSLAPGPAVLGLYCIVLLLPLFSLMRV